MTRRKFFAALGWINLGLAVLNIWLDAGGVLILLNLSSAALCYYLVRHHKW